MKRRAFYAAVFAAVAYVSFSAGESYARPKSSGGCSACGGSSAVSSPGSVTTTIQSNATGVYRVTCYGGQSCTKAKVDPSELRWEQHPDDPDSLTLYCGAEHVGSMRVSAGQYFPRNDGAFAAEPCGPPIAVPAGQVVQPIGATADETPPMKTADGRELFFGVEPSKVDAKPCYSINGKKCSKEQAFEAVGDGKASDIPDDVNKLSFTVVAPKPARDAIKAALQGDPEYAQLKQFIVEQYYDQTDPMVVGLGFPAVGVQDARGVMLCASEEATPQAAIEALKMGVRKRDPNVDPSKFPKAGDSVSLDGLLKSLGQYKDVIVGVLVALGSIGILKGGK